MVDTCNAGSRLFVFNLTMLTKYGNLIKDTYLGLEQYLSKDKYLGPVFFLSIVVLLPYYQNIPLIILAQP